MKPLALVAALLLALLAPTAPASAEDPVPVVTWPEVTAVNPDTTTYTITVDDTAGTGTLYAVWEGVRQEIPHEGEVALNFPTDDTSRFTVLRCNEASTCSYTGVVSPWIQAYREMHAKVLKVDRRTSSPGELSETVKFTPASPADTLDLTWGLYPVSTPEASPVATGTIQVQPVDDTGKTVVPVAVPAGLDEGDYRLRIEAVGDVTGFGHLESDVVDLAVEVDTTAPEISFETRWPVFYPSLKDTYRNWQEFSFTSSEPVTTVLEIRDSAGEVVSTEGDQELYKIHRFSWSGKASHEIFPAGRYIARMRVTDRAGNVATVRAEPFDLSLARVHHATWRKTFTAASTVLDRFVGSCSQLAKPSSHGWAGSLGYYSATRCAKPRQSVVSTLNGVYLPKSLDGKYSNFQVSLFGGAARGQDFAYLVMGTLRRTDNAFIQRTEMTGDLKTHSGAYFLRPDPILREDDRGRTYVYWEVGLTQGSRYDVKSFTVEIEYTALD